MPDFGEDTCLLVSRESRGVEAALSSKSFIDVLQIICELIKKLQCAREPRSGSRKDASSAFPPSGSPRALLG